VIRFTENPLGLKDVKDLALWLAKPEAQMARAVAEAKIAAHEVESVAAAVDALKGGRDHTFQADELLAETQCYRHFLAVLDELAKGDDLYTGQVSLGQ